MEHNVLAVKNLIRAMVDYGMEFSWNDSDVIDELVSCGITKKDFVSCGYGEFVKQYFDNKVDLNEYGKNVVNRFLDKCKANGSYKRVYEDFEDGTYLLEDTIENVSDFCAWLYETYDTDLFWVLDEWKDNDSSYAWRYRSKENPEQVIELSYEEVENELNKMFDVEG